MKKILSVLLASLLLLSTSATAFAMETETNADNWLVSANQHQIIHNAKIAAETGQNVTLTTKILSDLSDNHFELVEVGDTGYMIFDPQSGKYLEEALDSLNKDREFLTRGGVFTDSMIDAYIELKMNDVQRMRMTTHPAEFDMYFSL